MKGDASMSTEYRKVKPTKKVIRFSIGISVASWILVALGRQWSGLVIPLMFSILVFLYVRNDRILYNDQEVILLTPLFGKKIFLSWYEIKNVEVKYKSKIGRGNMSHNWYLIITYTFGNGRTYVIEKLYY